MAILLQPMIITIIIVVTIDIIFQGIFRNIRRLLSLNILFFVTTVVSIIVILVLRGSRIFISKIERLYPAQIIFI